MLFKKQLNFEKNLTTSIVTRSCFAFLLDVSYNYFYHYFLITIFLPLPQLITYQ